MRFDPHAFISYAHLDNEPLLHGKPCWVNVFHAALQVKLRQWLGEDVTIWRDDKLRGDDVFGQEILDRLGGAGILVSVVTPRYLASEWCKRELDAFAVAAEKTGGIVVRNHSRVLKVLKTPLPIDAKVPGLLDSTLGVKFYSRDREIDPALGAEAETEFLRRVVDLAALMADRLRALGANLAADSVLPPQSGQVVFVAECGRDLRPVRDALVTELRLHGHTVLPDSPLSFVEDQLKAQLLTDLQRATLAVHLVGSSPGPVPDGPTGQSLVALQASVAAAQSSAGNLSRIIWLPPGTQGERAEYKAFIDQLQVDAGLQQGADLLRGDAEELRAAVHQTLQHLRAPPTRPAPDKHGPSVYLVMTQQDKDVGRQMVETLRACGLLVSLPAFSGDAAEIRRTNAARLAAANAVLLLHGAGDNNWVEAQKSDIQRQAALTGPPAHCWTVVAAPRSDAKDEALLLYPESTLDLLGGDAATVAGAVAHALAATLASVKALQGVQ